MSKTIQLSAIVVATILVAGLIGVSFTDEVFAIKKDKAEVCHVNSANDVIVAGGDTFVFGKVIEVSENAVPAHENHGDSIAFVPLDEDFRDALEEMFGVSLPNANCFFQV